MIEKRSIRAILAAALCALGISLGAIFCPVTAFELDADGWALLLVCLAASIGCAVLLGIFRPVFGFGALLLSACLFLYFFHTALFESASYLLAAVFAQYVKAFHFSMPLGLSQALENGADATMALGVLAVLLALCTAWTVISRCTLAGVFLASLPFLVVCLVILQTEPATFPMLLLTGTLALLLLTQKLRFDTTQSGHRLTIRLFLPVALLIALLAVIFPRESYTRSEWSEKLAPIVSQAAEKLAVFRKNASTGQMEFVSPFTPSTLGRWAWDSSVSSVNLRRVGPQRKTGRRIMRVKSDYSAACHLRADSMAIYEDSTWRALKESDYENSGVTDGVLLSPSKQMLGLSSGNTFEIRTDMKSSIFYVPYRPLELPTGGEAVFDAYIKNPSQLTDYTVSYAYVEETADRNAQYEAFVHETYTQLPDDIRAELEPYVNGARAGLQTYTDAIITQRIAEGFAKYVSNTAAYSLDTPRAPDDEDFALWFLRESDTGYCVHFATVTVLLLRAAGIPARYVTGYYFTTQAGQWTDVLEDDAHAWVEYYLDGYGWQVLDPTPADTADAPTNEQDTQEPEQPEKTTTQEHPTQIEPQEPVQPAQSDALTAAPEDAAKPDAAGKKLLGAVWGILFFWVLLCAWQIVLLSLRRVAMQTGSSNKRAVATWRHIEFLCKLDKTEPPEQLHELALKARFSQHNLTKRELGLLQMCSDEKTRLLFQKAPWPKKLVLRLALALHPPLSK